MKKLWNESCRLLQEKVSADYYDRWVMQLKPAVYEGNRFELGSSNQYSCDFINENLFGYIYDAIKQASGNPNIQVSIYVDESLFEPEAPNSDEVIDELPKQPLSPAQRLRRSTELNPDFTFENFVVGPSNHWSCMATKVTSENPGKGNNPLFIYGPTGVGKTHLLQSAGNHALSINSNLKVIYITSEALLNEYVASFSTGDKTGAAQGQVQFRAKYRTVDILLIDDIQFLAGKKGLQEEFFHMFNALRDAHKQIIMTSDCPPREIKGLEERLVGRFQTGLTTEVEYPNFETRLAILRYKQDKATVKFSDSILTFIAENVQSSVRALEGSLNRAISFSELSPGINLSIDLLRSILKDLIQEETVEQLTCETIQKAVTEYYLITLAELLSKIKTRTIALPRQVAMYLCRKLTNSSLPEIAKTFGKTHATVLHGCKQVQGMMTNDPKMKAAVTAIAAKLGRDLNSV